MDFNSFLSIIVQNTKSFLCFVNTEEVKIS